MNLAISKRIFEIEEGEDEGLLLEDGPVASLKMLL